MSGGHAAVAASLEEVRARIARAAERAARNPEDVRLVAVTKGVDVSRIEAAIAAGVTDIGENRVQEARGKHAQVRSVVTWHLVGHLQTNKAAQAAALFDAVHSVDGERVARALAERRPAEREPLAALIEVELTGQPGRSGVTEDGAESLVRVVVGLPGIHLMGLMTIAPKVDAPEQARPAFIRLKHLRDRLEQACGWPLPELSMGMSDDFEVAVEEGATMVRIGRTIFSSAPAGRQVP